MELESFADDLSSLTPKAFPDIEHDSILAHELLENHRNHTLSSTQTFGLTKDTSKTPPIPSSSPTTALQSTFIPRLPYVHRFISHCPLPQATPPQGRPVNNIIDQWTFYDYQTFSKKSRHCGHNGALACKFEFIVSSTFSSTPYHNLTFDASVKGLQMEAFVNAGSRVSIFNV